MTISEKTLESCEYAMIHKTKDGEERYGLYHIDESLPFGKYLIAVYVPNPIRGKIDSEDFSDELLPWEHEYLLARKYRKIAKPYSKSISTNMLSCGNSQM